VLDALIEQLNRSDALSREQIAQTINALTSEQVAVERKADFLTALAKKGETPEEIAAFASELRARAIVPPLDPETRAGEILDVCGTGGDHLGTFNISTTVAIICAAAGVTVAKHGNRAITSKSGSADVLEALGIKIDLTPSEARRNSWAFRVGSFANQLPGCFKHSAVGAPWSCAEMLAALNSTNYPRWGQTPLPNFIKSGRSPVPCSILPSSRCCLPHWPI
jgi:anthranilate phosphoribosyltransferase